MQTVEKLVTDKVELEALLCGLEKVGREMQETWYTSLTGDTSYNKLKHLVAESQRVMKINERSKRWWDKELSEQVRKVAAAGRGGKGGSSRENNTMRWKKWKGDKVNDKGEKAKLLAKVSERAWDKGDMGSGEAGKKPMGIKE